MGVELLPEDSTVSISSGRVTGEGQPLPLPLPLLCLASRAWLLEGKSGSGGGPDARAPDTLGETLLLPLLLVAGGKYARHRMLSSFLSVLAMRMSKMASLCTSSTGQMEDPTSSALHVCGIKACREQRLRGGHRRSTMASATFCCRPAAPLLPTPALPPLSALVAAGGGGCRRTSSAALRDGEEITAAGSATPAMAAALVPGTVKRCTPSAPSLPCRLEVLPSPPASASALTTASRAHALATLVCAWCPCAPAEGAAALSRAPPLLLLLLLPASATLLLRLLVRLAPALLPPALGTLAAAVARALAAAGCAAARAEACAW